MPEGTYTMLKPTGGTPIWESYAPGEGAYYYAYAGSNSVATYKTASAIIILPTSKSQQGTGGGRNAYISFGVDGGAAGAIDIGIRNRTLPSAVNGHSAGDYVDDKGWGWAPFCGEASVGHDYIKNYTAPVGTKRAKLEVTPNLIEKNKVTLSVRWLDGNNNVIDASKNLINEVITLSKSYDWTCFYRFASLVTTDKSSSLSDSTYMVGAGFDSVKLGSTNWGISTSLVDTAWIINHPKCQLPYGYWATGEEFKIDHYA